MAPIVVRTVGADDDAVLVEARSPVPVAVNREQLAVARGAVRAAKHRFVSVTPSGDVLDESNVFPAALAAGSVGFDTPPAAPFTSNVGTAGLRKWADLLRATTGAKRWTRIFAEGRRAAIGLGRVHDCIDVDYTDGAACRPLFADFLRVAAALHDEALRDAGDAIDHSGRHWATIASLARSAHPSIETYVELGRARLDDTYGRRDVDDLDLIEDRRRACIDDCDIDAATAAEV